LEPRRKLAAGPNQQFSEDRLHLIGDGMLTYFTAPCNIGIGRSRDDLSRYLTFCFR
jgi:hypothetical protein